MPQYTALYFKPLSQSDPNDLELHAWVCQGGTSTDVLDALEENPFVPYRLFLVEVVPAVEREAWVKDALVEPKRLGLTLPNVFLHQGA